MKQLIRLAAKLYPRPWRDRYGREFEALLNDTGEDARTAIDVLKGAALMQVNRWRKIGAGVALALIALLAGSWWAESGPTSHRALTRFSAWTLSLERF